MEVNSAMSWYQRGRNLINAKVANKTCTTPGKAYKIKRLSIVGLALGLILAGTWNAANAVTATDMRKAFIVNHTTWRDTSGNMIYAHDGGLSRFGDSLLVQDQLRG